jgi:hypothetical protein
MSDLTTPARSAWEMRLYSERPRRRIPGTEYVAVTMYRSSDGSVRWFALFTADGMKSLGTAYYQAETRTRSRGYTLVQSPMLTDEKWPTLAAFATEMDRRLT